MVLELRVVERHRASTECAATVAAAHLRIGAIRQSRRRVTELTAAVVVPAHAEGASRADTNVHAISSCPLQLGDGGELPARRGVKPQRECSEIARRVRAVTPRALPAREILIRRALQGAFHLESVDHLATSKRQEIRSRRHVRPAPDVVEDTIRVHVVLRLLAGTAARVVAGELRERAGVDRREFLVVLFRRSAIDDPLAGVEPCGGHAVLVEREEPVYLVGAGARCGQSVPVMPVAVSVGRETEPATRGETTTGGVSVAVVAAEDVDEDVLVLEGIKKILHPAELVHRRLRARIDQRVRLRLIDLVQLPQRFLALSVKGVLRHVGPRRRFLGVQVEHLRQRRLLPRRQLVNV